MTTAFEFNNEDAKHFAALGKTGTTEGRTRIEHTPIRAASMSEFAFQERIDQAASIAEPLTTDEVAFLTKYADSVSLSIRLIYSDGKWLLERRNDNQWLYVKLVEQRSSNFSA